MLIAALVVSWCTVACIVALLFGRTVRRAEHEELIDLEELAALPGASEAGSAAQQRVVG